MGNKLSRLQKVTLVLGAATVTTLLCLPCPTYAQSSTTQDQQASKNDEITRRDLARFDQFLDSHRELADQLRKTPSLIDDPQFLQSHPELNAYLQDHPSVKQEISERPDTFMRLEDLYARDANLRDRDAGGQDRNSGDRRDVMSFNRFMDEHHEISEQVRKDPSLLDNRNFVHDHPVLESYLQDNPGVRDQLRQDPNGFMHQVDLYNRDLNARDRDRSGQDRNSDRRDVASFDRFLGEHREVAEQVRKDPSLLDNRNFVHDHPALETYLRDNPGVRDQLRQDPNAFMHQADLYARDSNLRDRDPMHDHMADFGGFLHNHWEIQRDLSRDPSCVKDQAYVQNHAELDAYLNAHPDVREELMSNPQSFVQGAQQYNNGSAGVSGRGTGTAGSMTGASTNPTTTNPTTTHQSPKPNQ